MTEVEVHEFIVQIFKSVAVKTDSKLTYIKIKWGWSSTELCEECVGTQARTAPAQFNSLLWWEVIKQKR